MLGLPHLCNYREIGGGTSVGKDMARDSSYGLNERRVVGESIIRLPFTDAPGCSSGTIFDTYSNGDGEDCGHNTDKADPSKPTDFAEGSNTGAKECQDGGNGHENGGASGVS